MAQNGQFGDESFLPPAFGHANVAVHLGMTVHALHAAGVL